MTPTPLSDGIAHDARTPEWKEMAGNLSIRRQDAKSTIQQGVTPTPPRSEEMSQVQAWIALASQADDGCTDAVIDIKFLRRLEALLTSKGEIERLEVTVEQLAGDVHAVSEDYANEKRAREAAESALLVCRQENAQLMAFVQGIASYELCDDAEKAGECHLDSGPYCGMHDSWIETDVTKARALLKKLADHLSGLTAEKP